METRYRAKQKPCPAGRRSLAALVALVALVAPAGSASCAGPLRFPAAALSATAAGAETVHAYDTSGDGKADYFATAGADGRIRRIAYDTSGDGVADSTLDLDDIDLAHCRHVVIVLDGVPHELMEEQRRQGRFRLFHPPSKLISTYPSMTDLALAEVFRSVKPLGYESLYYDHQANQLVGGNADYLTLKNEAWAFAIDYRAGTLWDPIAYLQPQAVFDKELADFRKVLDRRDRRHVVGYFVSTAGLATRDGAAGFEKFLSVIDRFCHQLIWETRGLVKLTLLSDHGHTLKRCERIDFAAFLGERGWRATDRLKGPRDVVPIEYGLITYASFATRQRRALAASLLEHEGVRLAIFEEADAVVVQARGAEARVERLGGRYRYTASEGDPLQLGPILARLKEEGKADAQGYVADADLFQATLDHVYPDPLDRLWRAFHGLVENVPDVIADLTNGYYAGAASRAIWFPSAASTHGDLERRSTTAVIMSTIGPLPPVLRSRDVPAAMEELTGETWPPPRGYRR